MQRAMIALAGLSVWLWCAACLAGGPVVRLTFVKYLDPPETRVEGGRTFTVRERHYGGSGVHVGDGCVITARHLMDDILDGEHEWGLIVDDIPIASVTHHASEDVDFAILNCAEIADFDMRPLAKEGHAIENPIWVYGYAGQSHDVTSSNGEVVEEWTHGHALSCEVSDGMSGGPAIDASGCVVGIVVTKHTDPADFAAHGRSSIVSGEVFQRECRHVMDVCPTWRPALHVWSSEHCGPCRQFWSDFDQDAAFRNHLLTYYRVIHWDADRSMFARWWGVEGVPCFAINPTCRVYGYSGKQDLLVRLGIAATADAGADPTVPAQPASPPQPHIDHDREPTPAQPIESQPPINFDELMSRLEAIERGLASLERRGEEGQQRIDNQIESLYRSVERLDLAIVELPAGEQGPAGPQGPQGERGERGEPGSDADVSALVNEINALRAELAAMRGAELTVNVYQPDGSVESGTVEIFDPNDSLDLNFIGRESR